jgi:hypothetical protein
MYLLQAGSSDASNTVEGTTMGVHTLEFRSPEKVLELQTACSPHSASIGSWSVTETYQPNTHRHVQEGLGGYRLILEKPVCTQDEVWAALGEAEQIAEELDVAWCYVCKSPFFAMRQTLVCSEAPTGWTGNTREIGIKIQKARGLGYAAAVQVAQSHWVSLPFLPLEKVLSVREAILKASPDIQSLVELHIAAHKSGSGKLFFLAKGLELAGASFGQARVTRNSGLHGEMVRTGISPHLTQSVGWLFDMANTRFDVRHVVNGYSPVTVHPKMNTTERREFEVNADLVIRSLLCTRLAVEIIL